MSDFFWNHRMVAVETHTYDDGEIETTLQFCEVHYDAETKRPLGYTDAFMVGNSPDEMAEIAKRLLAAAALPVLELSDFPDVVVAAEVERKPLAVEDVVCINPIVKPEPAEMTRMAAYMIDLRERAKTGDRAAAAVLAAMGG